MKNLKFSVLIPVYHGDKLILFREALESIFNQTLKPDQIVVVVDGPVEEELRDYLEELDQLESLNCLWLDENKGLGEALNQGLKACHYSIVARMDADDCALLNRFEKQIPLMKDFDLISGTLAEFEKDPMVVKSHRTCLDASAIKRWYWLKNPFNHPAVVFRKEFVEKSKGYLHMPFFEDWYLWIRMIRKGARFGNVVEPVVCFRTGDEQIRRRRGVKYMRHEFDFSLRLVQEGYIDPSQFLIKIILSSVFRLLPTKLFRLITMTILRK